jgi:hypothetical protein
MLQFLQARLRRLHPKRRQFDAVGPQVKACPAAIRWPLRPARQKSGTLCNPVCNLTNANYYPL